MNRAIGIGKGTGNKDFASLFWHGELCLTEL
jgi:hypothetical protein